jgi:hypothetical protein
MSAKISLDMITLEQSPIYQVSLAWQTPIVTSILYVIIVTAWSAYNRSKGASAEQPSALFRYLVILHNFLLCIYSAVTFLAVIPELLIRYFTEGPHILYDAEDSYYNEVLGFYTWLFYMSKYYELIDTLVILLKGRPSSFLQTFHHTGAIVGMWTLTSCRTPESWVFVGFNSFIHTWMYLYYMLTGLGYYSPLKKYLTNMQIMQFVIGNPLGGYFIFSGKLLGRETQWDIFGKLFGVNNSTSQIYAVGGNMVYVTALIFLFMDFRQRTYSAPKKEGDKKDDKKKKEE